MPPPPGPVTGADLAAAVAAAVAALRPTVDADWSVPAGDLEWTCWETGEHLADDLLCYATQLGQPTGGSVPIDPARRSPPGSENWISVDPAAGPVGLLDTIVACGALLSAMVQVAPPQARAFHVFGPADAQASAAMGVLETVVHAHDLAQGLGVAYAADPALCARVLARLMPEVEPAADPWTTLLWASGRIALSDRPRRVRWRWHNSAPTAGIALVTLVVPNYDEAIAFYVDTLGFTLAEDTELGAGKRWAVVAPPGGTGASLLLARADDDRQRARIGDQTGGRVALFLHTTDLDADHARMRAAAGVRFEEEPRDEPYGRVAVFADPYGNRWDLLQPR